MVFRPEFIFRGFGVFWKILFFLCWVLLEYKWVVLTVTTVGIFMATLDSSIVVVGLPQVVSDLKTNLVIGVWIITIYRLMITVLLVGIGRWADMHGRVRLYNMGFAVFTLGSLLSGLSPTAEALLAFRLVQGIGAALLFVNSVAIVTDAFSGKDLGKGIGINQAMVGASILCFALFIVIERKARYPALDLSLFKIRLFTAGNIANLLSGLAFAALAFVMTLYFQLVRGYDPLHAGIFLLPLDVTLILVGPISGWLSDKWGARGLSTMGLLVASAGFFLLAGFTVDTPYSEIALWLALV